MLIKRHDQRLCAIRVSDHVRFSSARISKQMLVHINSSAYETKIFIALWKRTVKLSNTTMSVILLRCNAMNAL